MRKALIFAATAISFVAVASVQAAPVAGTFSTDGAVTGSGTLLDPWVMTSTNSTYSILDFTLATPVAFADLTSVTAAYVANLGGIGQGAPRFRFRLDTTGDGVADGGLIVNWGPAGSFVDATLGAGNTGNLLALTDVGRYDLSQFGQSGYTDRATALSLFGSAMVTKFGIIIDSYGGNDRSFTINSLSADALSGAVPEPASWAMMIVGLGVVGASMRRRKIAVSFA